MNMIEEIVECFRQFAEDDSAGEGIDKYWAVVLPEMGGIIANEIFLILHSQYIDESMKSRAAQVALNLQLPDVSDIDVAELYLHCLVRRIWFDMTNNAEFRDFVNNNVSTISSVVCGDILNPHRIGWAKTSRLWLPLTNKDFVQIGRSLVERFKQNLFVECCWNELKRRQVEKKINKHMFALLVDLPEITQKHRTDAYQNIRNISEEVTKGLEGIDPRDPMHDWLAKLAALPRHTQLTKIGATPKAIHDRAKDIRRKGGKFEHVSFDGDGEYADIIPDDSLESPDLGIMDDEFVHLLSANRQEIEGILHRNSKIGARRFKILEMLAHTPTPTSVEIAKALGASEQTIGRDRHAIGQCWPAIHDVIYSQ